VEADGAAWTCGVGECSLEGHENVLMGSSGNGMIGVKAGTDGWIFDV